MTPLRLGPAGRRLFALLHPPAGAREECVVLCNPFGQEAIRYHRLLRLLAERLAAAGFATLRFDYFATGDSDGEDAQGDMGAWAQDVRLASDQALRLSGRREVVWCGLGLGGTLAALAAGQGAAPRRLLLWDPVVDGPAYLEALAAWHVREAEARTAPERERAQAQARGEALAFPIGAALRTQLEALEPASLAGLARCASHVFAGRGYPSLDALRGALPAGTRLEELNAPWLGPGGGMHAGAAAPPEALQAVVRACVGA